MTTTATYIIKAVVGGETYLFQYEHCYDAWAALEQFWHEDYPETIASLPDCGTFPIDILSMLEGKVIATMPVTFNCALFDHFFDKGWSASSHEPGQRYTLDQFAKDIAREPDTARDIRIYFQLRRKRTAPNHDTYPIVSENHDIMEKLRDKCNERLGGGFEIIPWDAKGYEWEAIKERNIVI